MRVHEEDAAALAAGFWFHDENWSLSHRFIQELVLELAVFGREKVRSRKELVVLRKFLSHLDQIPGEMVFTRQLEHAGEVIGFLVGLEFWHPFRWHTIISPKDVPIFLILCKCFWLVRVELRTFLRIVDILETQTKVVQVLCNVSHDKVATHAHVEAESLLLLELGIRLVIFDTDRFSELLHFLLVPFLLRLPIFLF